MTKSREQSSILNGKQVILNRDGLASGLTIEAEDNQAEDLFRVIGGNGNTFLLDKNANIVLGGYSETLDNNNFGVFDFTSASFFKCIPVDDITINPQVGDLEVISGTIHIDNSGEHQINMPPNTYWIHEEVDLSTATKCVLVLHSFDNGTNWFASFAGELPDNAPF